MDNPYYDEFQQLESFREQTWAGKREQFVETYGWAIPKDNVIRAIASYDNLVEMGAGSGYWAHLIEEVGGSVKCYDIDPPDNQWTDIQYGKPKDLDGITDPLLLIWPPYGESMAYDSLQYHDGETIIYVGENTGGCTGDREFHETLNTNYECETIIDIPQWDGLHDQCYVYQKV